MSYDLINKAAILVGKSLSDPSQDMKLLKSEFSKWNHPVRMKFLVSAAVKAHAHEFLDNLIDVAQNKNAVMVGPLIFEQVQHLADNVYFKHHAYELAQKSLALDTPKQLQQLCEDFSLKGQWRWAGLLFPHIKNQSVILGVYLQLMGRMTESLDDMWLQDRFENLSTDLHFLFANDPKGLQHWNLLKNEVLRFSMGSTIESHLMKQSLHHAIGSGENSAAKRKI